ncbi:MAG: valine--tRNA ligase [Methanocellales archaeon]
MIDVQQELPKEYDPHEIEEKWLKQWDYSMYHFNWSKRSRKERYIIDTPPPYPTGNFHCGNALNWCYIDFIARYKRMRGYNVMFPQGWDCHGLPTEVKVEQILGVKKRDLSREEFRALCEKFTLENIEKMRSTMIRLGFSIDWSNEYVTMHPSYYAKTQISFVRMYKAGLIYQADHPVNWCPRCETAIALSEVEYQKRITSLYYIHFGGIDIATTRPELIPACVAIAINPNDERYISIAGKKIKVPIFDYEVPVILDSVVDAKFGTGAVMICTFGDRQDVKWWKEHSLELRKAITKDGRMTELAGKYKGLSLDECKKAIIQDLKELGLIYKEEMVEQNVGLCWRCDTPIEILSEKQWFVKVNRDEVLKTAQEVKWVPQHMYIRLKNWVESMEWDWCISRQRVFATPIPAWYCLKCDETMVAKEEWLPLDPNQTMPKEPCKCGSCDFKPEQDVLDTWMDSSITPLIVAGWLADKPFLYPTELRPQGHDIIRTWAFYTILRSRALTGMKPWDTILINGMVFGEDGFMMSKSRGNIVQPEEVVEKYGADVFRQWAAISGSPGSDIMFGWKDIEAASRFTQKLWSIARFCLIHLKEKPRKTELYPVDKWLLSKLQKLIEEVTGDMENYEFDDALKRIRSFTWDILADNYIEMVKYRLYGRDKKALRAAQYSLYTAIQTLARLLAPFIPFLAEEIYSRITKGIKSVHLQKWPEAEESLIDEAAEKEGELIKQITSAIRRYKSEHGIALNAPLKGIQLYSPLSNVADVEGTVNARVEILKEKPVLEDIVREVKPKMQVLGPRFKNRAGDIARALSKIDPEEAAKMLEERGKLLIKLNEELIELEPSCIELKRDRVLKGKVVDVLNVGEDIIAIIMK